ncbi:hypothetical protein A3Q56_07441 [Intoshia linei]|uniref:Uncharacterized protein n=1 Tax=Intoshia linei TaxID=1819745 RepID=A0A177AU05_9BILA|nr:hypothetical protein A3Q56_07441 [Intoshia linei]
MDLKSSKEGTSCSSYVDSSDEEPSNEIRYTLSKMLAIREEFRKNPKRHECLLIDHCDQGIWSPLKYFDSKDRPQHSQENFNLNNNKIWKLTQSSPFKIQNGRKKSIKANISHESQSFKEDVNRFDVIKNFHKPNYSNSSQAYKPKSSNFYRKVHKPQSQQSFFTKNTPKNIVKVNLDSDKPNKSNRVEQNIETGNDRHGYRVYSYGNDQFDKISASILNDSSSLKKNIDVNTEKINVTQMSEITETVNKQEEKSFPIDLPDNVKSNQTDSILKSLEEVPKYEDKVNIVMNSIDQKLNISTIENSIFDTVCTQPIENQVSWNTQKFLTLPESIKVTEIVKPSMSKSNITKKYSDSLDNFINGLNIRNSTNNVLKNNVQNSVDYVNNIEGKFLNSLFFIKHNAKHYCLICEKQFSLNKYNAKRHFLTKYKDVVSKNEISQRNAYNEMSEKFNNAIKETQGDKIAYKIAMTLAKHCKPFQDSLIIKEYLEHISNLKIPESTIKILLKLHLSPQSITRRIDELADETNDIRDMAQVAVLLYCIIVVVLFVRMINEEFYVCEEIMGIVALIGTTKAQDVYSAVINIFEMLNVNMMKLTGIVTDGAAAMIGQHNGVATLLKKYASHNGNDNVVSYHCYIQQQALCSRVCDINDAMWLSDLFFMVDITSHLDTLNLKLQGKNKIITDYYDIVNAFECTSNRFFLFTKPFSLEPDNVSVDYQLELIDFKSNELLRDRFYNMECTEFYKNYLPVKYVKLKENALWILSLFGTIYLCEHLFSLLKVIKSEKRSCITQKNLSNCLQLKSTNYTIEQLLDSLTL